MRLIYWGRPQGGVQPLPTDVLRDVKGIIFHQLTTLLLSDRDASRSVKAADDNAVEISTTDGLSV
ncbi:MAG: hypothetical protein J2P21_31255 [Chloracidobacterium sp.]|nr:hypothetical protein [Chloracidobacterium sp.]